MGVVLPIAGRLEPPEIEYKLTDLVLLEDAPKLWPAFTLTELKRAARSRELPHIIKSRRRYVTEAHLKHWIRQKEQRASWQDGNSQEAARPGSAGFSSSGDTGSTREPIAPGCIDSGMTPAQEKFAAEALVQAILRPPN